MSKRLCLIAVCFFSSILLFSQPNYSGLWGGYILKDNKYWKLDVIIPGKDNPSSVYFDLPDYGLYHLAFDSVAMKNENVFFHYQDRNSKATFRGTLQGNQISGSWEGLGLAATFSVKKFSESSTEFASREVSFSNSGVLLAGTLILPAGKGPFGAVVQVHGSGNQTRSEEFYVSRAYLFAQNGIATLIYDRRGKGSSSGTEVSMELLADDAIAGVHFLQTLPEISKNRIGVMGFSQGGYVGPLAASRSRDVAFLIAGAAPGIPPDEQNDYSVENDLRRKSISEDTILEVIHFRKELRKYQYERLGNRQALENKLAAFNSKPWSKTTLLLDEKVEDAKPGVKEWLTFNPVSAWERVKVPVLLVWGALDKLVPPEKSKKIITEALNRAANPNVKAKIFPQCGHGLLVINNLNEFDWPRLANGYHSLLVEWTKEVIRK